MGPLNGLKIIEIDGLGPVTFAGMVLADMGADVLRISRGGNAPAAAIDEVGAEVLHRGRPAVPVDLKSPEDRDRVLDLIACADGLIEGFRPGVMERLGLGPEVCQARNPRLVYGRVTGWGQHGPLADQVGHDINYLSIAGGLYPIGPADSPPPPPLNMVADYGAGSMMLVSGLLAALLSASRTGKGQVIDAAMTDGAALLSAMMYGVRAAGSWSDARGENLLDGGAHFYDSYACADGKYVAVGAIEPQFYALLREHCGLDDPLFDEQMDAQRWPILKHRLADVFRTRTRDEWCALLEGTDACFAPVLDWDEAPRHAHNRARGTFVKVDGVVQPAPAPRFSRTPPVMPGERGEHDERAGPESGLEAALARWGVQAETIDALCARAAT